MAAAPPERFYLVSSKEDAGGLNGRPAGQHEWRRGEKQQHLNAQAGLGAGSGRVMKQLVTPG